MKRSTSILLVLIGLCLLPFSVFTPASARAAIYRQVQYLTEGRARAIFALKGASASTSSANSWSGAQTFASTVNLNALVTAKSQAITITGSVIDPAAGLRIRLTTGGITVKLPASPTLDTVLLLSYEAGSSLTLDGNGKNIDGSATATISASRIIAYNGTSWYSQTFTRALADTLYATLTGTNAFSGANTHAATETFNGDVSLVRQILYGSQAISLDGATHLLDPTLGGDVYLSGSVAGTVIQLPASPSNGLRLSFHFVPSTPTLTYTLDGNGQSILDTTGAVSTQAVASSRTLHFKSGTGWGQDGLTVTALSNRSNTYAAATTQTFSGGLTANGQIVVKTQAVALSGSTTVLDLTSGTTVVVTGSTGSSTLQLPGASSGTPPTSGTLVLFANQATVAWTLSANGSNVDGAASVSVSNSRAMVYTGSAGWTPVHLTQSQATALYGSLAASNTWSAANIFSSTLTANGATVFGRQSFNATGNISSSGAPLVEYTGSTGSQTLTLPSASAGLTLTVCNNASVTVTLSGNAQNVDGAASLSLPAGACVVVQSETSTWHTAASNVSYNNSIYGRLATASTYTAQQNISATLNASNQITVGGRVVVSGQTFTTNGAAQTITSAATSSAYVGITGSTASSTFNLPSSPSTNQVYIVKNGASVSVTLAGNGNNIEASSTLTLTAAQCRWVRYNGTTWDLIGGYG